MKSNKLSLYLDESGKSSLLEVKDPFIITGTIIHDDEIKAIEGFFTYIKRKFKIDENQPFHSYHTFEEPNTKLSDSTLQELAASLSEFISLIPIKTRILSVDKNKFRDVLGVKTDEDFKGDKTRKEMRDYPYRVMAADLFSWFAKELSTSNSIGQVVADSRRGGDHQLLKTLNFCKEGHVPYKDAKSSKDINDRITAICFAEKNFLAGGLEITDLISYVTYFKVRRLISANSHIGIDKLWESVRQLKDFSMVEIQEDGIRRFFSLKENEVHKYLRQ